MANVDACGVYQILRDLIERGVITEQEARGLLSRVIARIGADIVLPDF